MKHFVILLLLFITGNNLWAQHPGFSKRYRYSGDTIPRTESISGIVYDTAHRQFFFCTLGLLISSGSRYSTFYKTDEKGNVIKETIDSMSNGSSTYFCVTESTDGYLYWGGYSLTFGDTTSINWKIRKTDKDLNVIWDKFYHSPYAANFSYNIKSLDNNRLMLLCFDYTHTNSLGMPVKRSTPLMRLIDSTGNIISDHRPLELDYTDAYGLEPTNDGGFMVNGTSNYKGFALKTDNVGNYLWHRFYGTDASAAWLLSMCRQPGEPDNFYHAGEIMPNSNSDIAYALKTDSMGNVLWEKRINKNNSSDAFFAVTPAGHEQVLFAGDSYFANLQAARGWMVKLDKDGNELWNKLYTTPHPADYHDYLYKVITLPDGGFAAAGSTFAQDTNGYWTQHAWLLRVDSNGCYNPACTDFTAVNQVAAPTEAINLFPNPSPGLVHLIKTSPFPAGTIVTLTDAAGKLLRTLESPAGKTQQVYQLRGTLLPGTYFIRVTMGELVVDKKLVLMF